MKTDFPQDELQEWIYNFWKVRGYGKVTAVLGNLSVSFHKDKERYESLGLSYDYLEQFYKEAKEKGRQDAIKEICKKHRIKVE